MRQMLTQAQTSGQYFFFNDTATTEIYTLSLHDALPISEPERGARAHADAPQLHVAAELGQHVAHEVVLPDAHPRGGDEQVGVLRSGEMLAQAFLGVSGHPQVQGRSEEHTSELQSPCNLV